jgi:hypothetical protein
MKDGFECSEALWALLPVVFCGNIGCAGIAYLMRIAFELGVWE